MSARFIKNIPCLFLASTFMSCSFFTPASTPTSADIEKEEQAVYSSFFGSNATTIVILQETSTNISSDNPQQSIDYIKSGLKGVSKETLNNYLERNRQPSQLSPDMQIGVKYILISRTELSTIMSQPNGWDAYYKEYSHGGYTQFSRVGFNNTQDQAVVYVGSMAGPLMGAGYYYLMEKKDGKWTIKEQVMAWIS